MWFMSIRPLFRVLYMIRPTVCAPSMHNTFLTLSTKQDVSLLIYNKTNSKYPPEYRTLGNFRGTKFLQFSRYCTASVKIKSAKNLYDPLCSALCTGVLAKNKEAGVLNVSYIIYHSFSRPLCRSSHSLPQSDAPYSTKIWKAAGEDQLQQFALVLITVPRNNNHANKQSSHFSVHNLYRITYC